MNVTGTLGGLTLKPFTIPFLENELENATDITTLDQTIYTDFISKKKQWTLNWGKLDEVDYNDLKAIYDTQFTTSTYPTFICAYYSINTQVRMYINEKDVRKDGCYMVNVQVKLIEDAP